MNTFCGRPLLIREVERLFLESRPGKGIILDGTPLRKMFFISEMMKRLAPMYTDDRRLLWIEAVRGTPEEWLPFERAREEYEGIRTRDDYLRVWREENPDEKQWFEVVTGYYKDIHHLTVSNGTWRRCSFSNRSIASNGGTAPCHDCGDALDRLGDYIRGVIDRIEEDPDAYNAYLEANLPLSKRTGTISGRDYRRITGADQWADMPEGAEAFLERMAGRGDGAPLLEGPMTLRRYAGLWALALAGARGHEEREVDDPLEAFSMSSKGYGIEESYDLDSEEEYLRWAGENRPYHCHDIIYARVHLVPGQTERGWKLSLSGE